MTTPRNPPKPPPVAQRWSPKDGKVFFGKNPGATAFVVAFGWSLQGFRWSKLQGHLVIGLNDSIRHLIPTYWAFTDGTIYRNNHAGFHGGHDTIIPPDLPIFIPGTMRHLNFPWPQQAYGLKLANEWKPHQDPDSVYMWATVATWGVSIAYRLGAKRIILVGVDACMPSDRGKGYYADGKILPDQNYARSKEVEPGIMMEPRHHQWVESFKKLHAGFQQAGAYEAGLEILNASPVSQIDIWPKVNLEDYL